MLLALCPVAEQASSTVLAAALSAEAVLQAAWSRLHGKRFVWGRGCDRHTTVYNLYLVASAESPHQGYQATQQEEYIAYG